MKEFGQKRHIDFADLLRTEVASMTEEQISVLQLWFKIMKKVSASPATAMNSTALAVVASAILFRSVMLESPQGFVALKNDMIKVVAWMIDDISWFPHISNSPRARSPSAPPRVSPPNRRKVVPQEVFEQVKVQKSRSPRIPPSVPRGMPDVIAELRNRSPAMPNKLDVR